MRALRIPILFLLWLCCRTVYAAQGLFDYEFEIVTGNQEDAGTNAQITINIAAGEGAWSEPFILPRNHPDTERGRTLRYKFVSGYPDYGDLNRLRLRHDNQGDKPGWFVDRVTVRKFSHGEARLAGEWQWGYPPQQRLGWLTNTPPPKPPPGVDRVFTGPVSPPALVNYEIEIRTADDDKNEGTDANITLQIIGDDASDPWFIDDPGHNDFERGSVFHKTFFDVRDLGNLTTLKLGHDNTGNKPAWKVDYVIVRANPQGCGHPVAWKWSPIGWLGDPPPPEPVFRTFKNPERLDRYDYEVEIKTAIGESSGTDAKVFLVAYGKLGDNHLVPWEVDCGGSNCEEGARTIQRFTDITDLGELASIRLSHDDSGGKPGWFPERLEIRKYVAGSHVPIKGWEWFPLGWLATSEPPNFATQQEFVEPSSCSPCQTEVCDGRDNDCDGVPDPPGCFLAKPPVIFLPGAGGSSLEEVTGGVLIERWPSCGTTPTSRNDYRELTLDTKNPDYREAIGPGDVLHTESCGFGLKEAHIYGETLQFLRETYFGGQTQEYRGSDCESLAPDDSSSPRLFTFAYDWRKSIEENAVLLNDLVHCVKKFHPGEKVDFVSHSMGGLVGRRYLLDHPSDGFVRKFVTLGAPWLGAPKMLDVMETGDFQPELIAPDLVRDLVHFFSGIHELLPLGPLYWSLTEDAKGPAVFREDGWDYNQQDGDHQIYGRETLIQALDRRDDRYIRSKPGTTAQVFHETPGQDDWSSDDPSAVEYFHLYSRRGAVNTIGGLIARTRLNCLNRTLGINCVRENYVDRQYVFGDGTVPFFSLSRGDGSSVGRFNAPESSSVAFCGGKGSDVEHGELARNPAALTTVQLALDGEQLSSRLGSLNGLCGSATVSVVVPLRYLRLIGIKSLSIRDESGREVHPLDGTVEEPLPEVEASPMSTRSAIVTLPADGAFTIRFSNEGWPVFVELIEGTPEAPERAVRWVDIPISGSGQGILTLASDGAVDLGSDDDYDGTPERLVPPTFDGTGPQAAAPPPQVVILITRVCGGMDVQVDAASEGAGISRILVSIDGKTFTPYLRPFFLPLVFAGARLTVLVEDRAGNSTIRTQELSPLPLSP